MVNYIRQRVNCQAKFVYSGGGGSVLTVWTDYTHDVILSMVERADLTVHQFAGDT